MVITQIKSLPQGVRAEIISIISIMKPHDVFCYESQPYWIDPMVKYLKMGELPLDRNGTLKPSLRVALFTVIEGKLYRREFHMPLQ